MLKFMLPLVLLQASPETPAEASAQSPTVKLPVANCETDQHGGFDFWVGEWDVFTPAANGQLGESRIERKHKGCAVIENWMPLNGQGTGTSLNHYNSKTGQWHQKWVGSTPEAVEFTGGVVDGKMVLTGNWPQLAIPHLLVRMTWTPNEDGSVRQHGEASRDHGLTWGTMFDYLYRPKTDTEPGD